MFYFVLFLYTNDFVSTPVPSEFIFLWEIYLEHGHLKLRDIIKMIKTDSLFFYERYSAVPNV
jgi:hypothetical protein